MADKTDIEWTDATWNPITGCAVVSRGCTNCYAMKLAGTRLKDIPSRAGLTKPGKAGPVWTGEVRLNYNWLDQPLRWRRPRKIFVCAHGDLFAENVPDEWIDRVFAVMALAPHHTFQVLTKRSARMLSYVRSLPNRDDLVGLATHQILDGRSEAATLEVMRRVRMPLPNVWLGVSAEDQRRADERVPDLVATPAAMRFVSAEPLLGPIDFRNIQPAEKEYRLDALAGSYGYTRPHLVPQPRIHQVIVGGESGRDARPMLPDWPRQIRDDCVAAGTAFFFKQWGHFAPIPVSVVDDEGNSRPCQAEDFEDPKPLVIDGAAMLPVGKKAAGRLLDGREYSEMPEARP